MAVSVKGTRPLVGKGIIAIRAGNLTDTVIGGIFEIDIIAQEDVTGKSIFTRSGEICFHTRKFFGSRNDLIRNSHIDSIVISIICRCGQNDFSAADLLFKFGLGDRDHAVGFGKGNIRIVIRDRIDAVCAGNTAAQIKGDIIGYRTQIDRVKRDTLCSYLANGNRAFDTIRIDNRSYNNGNWRIIRNRIRYRKFTVRRDFDTFHRFFQGIGDCESRRTGKRQLHLRTVSIYRGLRDCEICRSAKHIRTGLEYGDLAQLRPNIGSEARKFVLFIRYPSGKFGVTVQERLDVLAHHRVLFAHILRDLIGIRYKLPLYTSIARIINRALMVCGMSADRTADCRKVSAPTAVTVTIYCIQVRYIDVITSAGLRPSRNIYKSDNNAAVSASNRPAL